MQYGFLDFMVHDRKYSVIPFIKSSETIPFHCKPSSHRHNMCSKHTPQDSTIEEEVEAIIEEQSTVVPQEEVIEYKEPVLNYGLYEPLLDAESEFPWHHPGNQFVNEEVNVPQIDMSQFHDPWEIYRGNIPPSTEDSNQQEKTCDFEDVRKNAWDYTPSHHNQYITETSSNYEQPHPEYHHTHEAHHHQHEHFQRSSPESSQNIQHSEHNFPQYHHDHNKHFELHKVEYHNQHETQNFYYNNDEQQSKQQEPFYPHEHHEPYYDQSNHNSQILDKNHESQANNHILHSLESVHDQKQSKSYNKVDSFTYSQIKNKNISEQVYTLMMDHVRIRNEKSVENVNGYASDNDSDIYEDIRPRHPYDGFYLRHRMTIDSRGRKICIHEVPYIPRTPSSVSSEEYEDALETPPDDNDMDFIDDVQTGVAGNLARIVPGAPLQREAVDELARRQGWEAGNIDYMGADSFDNIWAKISQTLSQPPTSVEQPPAPELSSPTEQEPTPTETKLEQPSEPIDSAVKETEKESLPETTVEKVSVEEPSQTPASLEAPATADAEAVPSQIKPELSTPATEAVEPESVPVPAEVAADVAATESIPDEKPEAIQEIPVTAVEALKIEETPKDVESAEATIPEPVTPEVVPEPAVAATEPAQSITDAPSEATAVPQVTETKPETTSDSPPLANTPSKEEIPQAPAAKSTEEAAQETRL